MAGPHAADVMSETMSSVSRQQKTSQAVCNKFSYSGRWPEDEKLGHQ